MSTFWRERMPDLSTAHGGGAVEPHGHRTATSALHAFGYGAEDQVPPAAKVVVTHWGLKSENVVPTNNVTLFTGCFSFGSFL